MTRIRPSFIKSLNTDTKMTIKDWVVEILCYNPPGTWICRIIRFIKRLFRWIPVLWDQEEWDFGFTYDILKLRLQELRKDISEDTIHTEDCVQEELQQIDSVLEHLDKFRNWTDYIDIPETPEGWDEHPFDPETGLYEWRITPEQHEAYDRAHKFEEEHYNAFWDELKQNSGNWWV